MLHFVPKMGQESTILIQSLRRFVYDASLMSWRRYYIVFLAGFVPVFTAAQAIDNILSFRNISSDHYFRINYENDFFSGTDRDYTQGIYIEKVTPGIRRFF